MSAAGMHVVFRADASVEIGTGHVMRCLALADELRARGAKVHFICREHPSNLCDLIARKNYSISRLPAVLPHDSLRGGALGLGVTQIQDAKACEAYFSSHGRVDWLVVDHYGIGASWESLLRRWVNEIMVIDDLANRFHDCDLLLDQNFYQDYAVRYDELVSAACKKLVGPRYALLRAEFTDAKLGLRKRDGVVRRIFVFFGGIDLTNETSKALTAIARLNRPNIEVDVVVGAANPHREFIEKICALMPNVTYHRQVSNMAELMASADLSFGAGGSATWERCFLGLPSLTIVVAENQEETTIAAAKTGAIKYLGLSSDITPERIASAAAELIDSPEELRAMSRKSLTLIGGDDFQGAGGVAEVLCVRFCEKK